MLKLLIADDEADTSNAIRKMIPWEKNDITLCSPAANGREAIEIIQTEHPDIALLDVRMPLVDGLGVAEYIYQHELPICTIILSGYNEFSYAQTALRYGVFDYLLKPCRMEDLLQSILKCRKQLLCIGERATFTSLPSVDLIKKKLLETIRLCDTDTALELNHEFFHTLSTGISVKSIHLNYILSLMMDISRLCAECSIPQPTDMPMLLDYTQLARFSSIRDIETSSEKIITSVSDKIACKSGRSVPVHAAVKYIEKHYSEVIDLNVLAEQIHITPAYFSLLFKMQTGVNFLDYLTRYRIDKACELLKDSTLKTYEIAYETGFRDEKYFSTVFKKLVGMPPSKYRKIHA